MRVHTRAFPADDSDALLSNLAFMYGQKEMSIFKPRISTLITA